MSHFESFLVLTPPVSLHNIIIRFSHCEVMVEFWRGQVSSPRKERRDHDNYDVVRHSSEHDHLHWRR